MMGRRTGFWIAGIIVIMLALGVLSGVAVDRALLSENEAPREVPAGAEPEFALMREAWDLISAHYVEAEELEARQMAYGAISGLVDSLGDVGHSRFLTPEMLRVEHGFRRGEFEGIGAEVRVREGHIVIVAAVDGSPAERAGLRTGDIILRVNGEEVTGRSLSQVTQLIMGPAGTEVTLTLLRPSTGETRDITLVRERIRLRLVSWAQLPGTDVADVRISAFSEGAGQELRNALEEINQRGLKRMVLDLRRNPGGLLNEAVAVASEFVSGGNVAIQRDAQGRTTPIPAQPNGLATQEQLVVLVDGGTASGAEIVAGALQARGRAKLIGEQTVGAGTVLGEFGLSDGSAMLLATHEWLTPDSRSIWREGLMPDEVVALPPAAFPLLPQAAGELSPEQLRASQDVQLLTALRLLRESPAP